MSMLYDRRDFCGGERFYEHFGILLKPVKLVVAVVFVDFTAGVYPFGPADVPQFFDIRGA
jgi:hypothetical protein